MYIFNILLVFTLFQYSYQTGIGSGDLYAILGVSRTADFRDIRKAYKKLALTLHPDKNLENKTAHETFLQVTKAYEVLKDPETRRKYDLYGEQTLGNRAQNMWRQEFHDYTYFKNRFGFFDDDDNIIALTESDFEHNIKQNGESWYVFFYNPHCNKCHSFRKVWQKVAYDLDGVIQIGAINCQEDISLCSKMGYARVPKFVLFNNNIETALPMSHDNYKTVDELIEFVMSNLKKPLIYVTDSIWDNETVNKWVLSLCQTNDKDLLNKLSIILDKVISVGKVTDEKLCSAIYHEYKKYPLIYLERRVRNSIASYAVQHIEGHTSKQLANQVLELLPNPKELNLNDFKDIETKLKSSTNENPWLICFYAHDFSRHSLLLKRLPFLLPNINIGVINCQQHYEICQQYRISSYPSWGVLKTGGLFELHYGRQTLFDLATFAKDSINATNFKYLTLDDFNRAVASEKPWVIVWSVSWCDGCRKFIPILRRNSMLFKNMNYGIIDCIEFRDLCVRNNIRSYPTLRFYAEKNVYHFFGPYTSDNLMTFIQEMLDPKIIYVSSNNFHTVLENKKEDEIIVALYFSPLCGSCHHLHSQWRNLALELSFFKKVQVIEIDCIQSNDICRKQRITFYPTVRIYPTGSTDLSIYDLYRGDHNVESLLLATRRYIPCKVKHLLGYELQQQIRSFSVSLILFYDKYDETLKHIVDEFIQVAESDLLPTKVNTRIFNCKTNTVSCINIDINNCPQIVLYDYGTRYFINSRTQTEIIDEIKTHLYLPSHDEL